MISKWFIALNRLLQSEKTIKRSNALLIDCKWHMKVPSKGKKCIRSSYRKIVINYA